jgi:two-component system C4-dicarboxylate transport response regulator DctD
MGLGLQLGLSGAEPEPTQDARPESLHAQMEAFERALLICALRQYGGRVTEACVALDLPRKTFYDKLVRHGLKADTFRN